MFCSNCGIKLADGIYLCPDCGTSVIGIDSIFCSSCGAKLIDDKEFFCPNCREPRMKGELDIYDRGCKYAKSGDYVSAIKSFETVINNYDAIKDSVWLPKLFVANASAKFCLVGDAFESYLNGDDTALQKETLTDFLDVCTQAVKSNPERSQLYYFLYYAYVYLLYFEKNDKGKRNNYYKNALDSITIALKLDPHNEDYLEQRQNLLEMKKGI